MAAGALTAVVLAGGQSRRMGRDKARIIIAGEPLLERTVRVAAAAGLPVIVVGRQRPPDYCGLDVPFFEDQVPGAGPLGGLLTALRMTGTSVLLLACDLPRLSAEAVRWLAGETPGPCGLAVMNGAQVEPLFSIYTPACAAAAAAHLAAGKRSLRGLIAALDLARSEAPPWVAPCLRGANTPQELETTS
jgi:molybdopterin-guanine dinucleotide biosynthesis protein A